MSYEDLVTSTPAVARRLSEACGLEWRESALDITQNKSASLTASAAQVRGGIYATSAGVWQKYRRHLLPLVDQLKRCGISTDS